MSTVASYKSQTARTFDLLKAAIVEAKYAPGDKLKIDQLSEAFDSSSGAVREALSGLTAEGLVVAQPQKGFVVAPISRRDLEDLTQVRVQIECRCLADTIAAAGIEWEGRILSLQHQLRALEHTARVPGSREGQQWHQLHFAFHSELTSLCPNTWWQKLRQQLFIQSERYRRLSGPLDEEGRDVSAEHEAIAKAAIIRDTEAAVRHMAAHLRRTTDILLKSRIPFSED
ncbi:MAG: FCD domain-containing protein [Mesorhizobium sp.]|uniref:GntR family transcriptional regulator n=1 Tax=unclassified Mesorhizobium TaxID=325217 RepID=UPI000F757381|nr:MULTISPECIES: GntR family transcriptional regulator [unclassified Mesorhizobium]AZO33600.1 GntR family transcriptional regulator [Mesorhizobium sp. M2A.F.Ca.ET.046.03.2.1]MBZ9694935.1 GntR family transcriptional regulator [Mesorhizobium sp. CO1-1-9]RWB38748.1 MAG: FCD domain-containing protein [Mesorhizobium sp.]RWE22200.1 MAG: FCD domain-containing protein [Mesorhizobium sp.]